MSQKEAFDLISKYDGEYPIESIQPILEFLEINESELTKIIDLHRRPDIWERSGNTWKLKQPLSSSSFGNNG